MENKEKFDKWFEGRLAFCNYDKDYTKVMIKFKLWLLTGFEAGKQDSGAEIAELKAEIEGYHLNYKDVCIDNLKLREALGDIANANNDGVCIVGNQYFTARCVATEALASTPSQSLQDHDDVVIEKIAEYVCKHIGSYVIAKDIRELKGKL